MGYGDGVRIERAANGYTITMRDPAIVKKNQQREIKSDYRAPYIDPDKTYIFPDMNGLVTFLKANLDKALPKLDIETAFTELTKDDD